MHDLSAESVFEGCANVNANTNDNGNNDDAPPGQVVYKLGLVLRKWFAIDPSREMRAFVREGVLVGACVRFQLSFPESPSIIL